MFIKCKGSKNFQQLQPTPPFVRYSCPDAYPTEVCVHEGWLIPKEGITTGNTVGVMCQVRRVWGRKSCKTTVLGSQGVLQKENTWLDLKGVRDY